MRCRTASLRRGRRADFVGSWLLEGELLRQLQICKIVRMSPLVAGYWNSLVVRVEAILVFVLLGRRELGGRHDERRLQYLGLRKLRETRGNKSIKR